MKINNGANLNYKVITTVNVRNPNVRISDSAEIRTFCDSVWSCSNKPNRTKRSFGFQTHHIYMVYYMVCPKSERSNDCCSDFRHKFVSENRTILFGFQTFSHPNKDCNRTMDACLKSERVRISDVRFSDVYCT